MKKLIYCLAFAASNVFAQVSISPMKEINSASTDKFITVNSAQSIADAYKNEDLWNGRSVSIEGVIESVSKNSRGQSSIVILLDKQTNTKIRAVSALGMEKSYFSTVGERLKVMGWLFKTKEWATLVNEKPLGDKPLLLLSACFVHVKSNDQLFDKKYLEFCDAWGKKFLPPDMKTNKKD